MGIIAFEIRIEVQWNILKYTWNETLESQYKLFAGSSYTRKKNKKTSNIVFWENQCSPNHDF